MSPLRVAGLAAALALAIAALAPVVAAETGFSVANLDQSGKPCQDFFRYAMGGWQATNPIPATSSRWSVLDELRQQNRVALRGLLESAARQSVARSAAAQKAGDYYASCMNVGEREAAGITPIAPYLRGIASVGNLSDVRLQASALQNLGAKAFFFAGSEGDPRDEQRTIPFISQGGLGLPDRALYFASDATAAQIREAYVSHVTRDFRLAGEDAVSSATDARAVFTFEEELARAARPRAELRDRAANYHKLTLAELQSLMPIWSWSAFFHERMASNVDEVDVQQPEYLRKLDSLLRVTPLSQLRAYLRYHLMERTAPALGMSFANESAEFAATVLGREPLPLWSRCVRMADADLGDALGQLYVEHYFNPATRVAAKRVVDSITAEFRRRITSADWMSQWTRREAAEKLDAIRAHIGFPDAWRAYDTLAVDRGPFIENSLRASLYRARNTFSHLGTNPKHEFWTMTAPTVNAAYSAANNDVTFPAGLLQSPVFSVHYDDALNYGAFGVIVAHELTHAFDDEGRRSDAQGNLRDWWQPSDAGAWALRQGCVQHELESFRENERLVAGEALADLGGVEIAYGALERTLGRKHRARIDGWTPEQRFFLAFAQTYASFEVPQRMRVDGILDPHPDGRERVLQTLANIPQFSSAFACRAGDAMVRPASQRCTLW